MKKICAVLILLILALSSLYADFAYVFDLVSFDPLYKEYYADRYRAGMSFNYADVKDGLPEYVYQDWRQSDHRGDAFAAQTYLQL